MLVANYGGGSVAAFPLGSDGALSRVGSFIQHQGSSVDPKRQTGPHGHCINPSPDNRFALACDLGLDKVLIYRLDPAQGKLIPHEPPSASLKAGAGPRHLAFDPTGRFVYVINELNSSMTVFTYEAARGTLQEVQTISTLPADFTGHSSCAEVQVHPSGKFVYGSNRGHDSIAIYAADPKSGALRLVGHEPTQGKTPRHFGVDPTGRWMLVENQGSDNIVVFRIDAESGSFEGYRPGGRSRFAGVCRVREVTPGSRITRLRSFACLPQYPWEQSPLDVPPTANRPAIRAALLAKAPEERSMFIARPVTVNLKSLSPSGAG